MNHVVIAASPSSLDNCTCEVEVDDRYTLAAAGGSRVETWQIVGIIDVGAVNFPKFKRVTMRYKAGDWQRALELVEKELHRQGTPVTLESLTKIHPRPQPFGD